jgi:hypothetical protein
MLLCAAAFATLLATGAQAQESSLQAMGQEFNSLPPAQQKIAIYAMMHNTLMIVRQDGKTALKRSDPEASTMIRNIAGCNIQVAEDLRNGDVQTPDDAALDKARCIQRLADDSGFTLYVAIIKH